MNRNDLPVRRTMCGTCPYREGSEYAYLKDDLTRSAMSEASRICHSTGSDNGIHRRTGVPSHICRGSRDVQLQMFHSIGVIDAPTDEAWNNKRVEIGMRPQTVQNPSKKQKAT